MVEKSETGALWPSLYEPFRTFGTRLADWLSPAAEASGNDQAYLIEMELPGVSEDDIELMVEEGVVTIRGEKKTERETKGDTWYFSERQYGAFRRSFRLPADAEADGVSAQMKDGVLRVRVPRKTPQASETARRIEIAKG